MANLLSKVYNAMAQSEPRQHLLCGELSGGLNLWELDYRMDANQSPEMENLWWRDGLLGCRDGQEWVSPETEGRGYACYPRLFHGFAVLHIGDGLYAGVPGSSMTLQKLYDGVPASISLQLWHSPQLLMPCGC